MILSLTYDNSHYQREAQITHNKLVELDYEISTPGDVIELDDGKISLQAYQQIKSRDPGNRVLNLIRKKILENTAESIEISDALLVLNFLTGKPNIPSGNVSSEMFFSMTIAWYLTKPIYLLEPPNRIIPFIEDINALNPVILRKDFSKIVPPISKPIGFLNPLPATPLQAPIKSDPEEIPVVKRRRKKI